MRSERFLNCGGMVDWNMLLERFRNERLVMFPIQLGNLPVNLLLERSRNEIDVYDDGHVERCPINPVPANMSWKSLIFSNQKGMVVRPKGLKDKSRVWSWPNPSNDWGIGPDSWFLDKSKN